MERKKDYRNHPIRMSDELWYKIMAEAAKRKMDIAELIRQILTKEMK
jgi:predicted DNA-binding ribbon-helix-helix protein